MQSVNEHHSCRKGCDPEVFLFDPRTDKFKSSVGLIGGSKWDPKDIGQGCAVQEDNVAVEFNTPPCSSAEEFIKHINYNKQYIAERAHELGLDVKIIPSAVFPEEELQTNAAKEFGCEPDYCAWHDGAENPRPNADNKCLRSAGGHIHLELEKSDDILEVVKALDYFVGCQMLEFDDDKGRRELYGKYGAFRPKKYGVEYRTASNKWIESNERIQWAWDQSDKAVDFVRSGKVFTEEQGNKIKNCINNSDLQLLKELQQELGK